MSLYPIRLTPAEVMMAGMVGFHRNVAALTRGLADQHGFNGVGWNNHIEGACGELAVARLLNRAWSPTINTFKFGGDVDELHVRTRSKADYELIIRKADPVDVIFVLVTGCAPLFSVVGWIKSVDARKPEWLANHGGREPAWFVPHKALHDMNELQALPAVRCEYCGNTVGCIQRVQSVWLHPYCQSAYRRLIEPPA